MKKYHIESNVQFLDLNSERILHLNDSYETPLDKAFTQNNSDKRVYRGDRKILRHMQYLEKNF